MSDATIVKSTVDESAGSPSFWRKIFLDSRGSIRTGWRLTIFLLLLAASGFSLFAIGILRITYNVSYRRSFAFIAGTH